MCVGSKSYNLGDYRQYYPCKCSPYIIIKTEVIGSFFFSLGRGEQERRRRKADVSSTSHFPKTKTHRAKKEMPAPCAEHTQGAGCEHLCPDTESLPSPSDPKERAPAMAAGRMQEGTPAPRGEAGAGAQREAGVSTYLKSESIMRLDGRRQRMRGQGSPDALQSRRRVAP